MPNSSVPQHSHNIPQIGQNIQSQSDFEISTRGELRPNRMSNQISSQTDPNTQNFPGPTNFSQGPNNLNFLNPNIAPQALPSTDLSQMPGLNQMSGGMNMNIRNSGRSNYSQLGSNLVPQPLYSMPPSQGYAPSAGNVSNQNINFPGTFGSVPPTSQNTTNYSGTTQDQNIDPSDSSNIINFLNSLQVPIFWDTMSISEKLEYRAGQLYGLYCIAQNQVKY